MKQVEELKLLKMKIQEQLEILSRLSNEEKCQIFQDIVNEKRSFEGSILHNKLELRKQYAIQYQLKNTIVDLNEALANLEKKDYEFYDEFKKNFQPERLTHTECNAMLQQSKSEACRRKVKFESLVGHTLYETRAYDRQKDDVLESVKLIRALHKLLRKYKAHYFETQKQLQRSLKEKHYYNQPESPRVPTTVELEQKQEIDNADTLDVLNKDNQELEGNTGVENKSETVPETPEGEKDTVEENNKTNKSGEEVATNHTRSVLSDREEKKTNHLTEKKNEHRKSNNLEKETIKNSEEKSVKKKTVNKVVKNKKVNLTKEDKKALQKAPVLTTKPKSRIVRKKRTGRKVKKVAPKKKLKMSSHKNKSDGEKKESKQAESHVTITDQEISVTGKKEATKADKDGVDKSKQSTKKFYGCCQGSDSVKAKKSEKKTLEESAVTSKKEKEDEYRQESDSVPADKKSGTSKVRVVSAINKKKKVKKIKMSKTPNSKNRRSRPRSTQRTKPVPKKRLGKKRNTTARGLQSKKISPILKSDKADNQTSQLKEQGHASEEHESLKKQETQEKQEVLDKQEVLAKQDTLEKLEALEKEKDQLNNQFEKDEGSHRPSQIILTRTTTEISGDENHRSERSSMGTKKRIRTTSSKWSVKKPRLLSETDLNSKLTNYSAKYETTFGKLEKCSPFPKETPMVNLQNITDKKEREQQINKYKESKEKEMLFFEQERKLLKQRCDKSRMQDIGIRQKFKEKNETEKICIPRFIEPLKHRPRSAISSENKGEDSEKSKNEIIKEPRLVYNYRKLVNENLQELEEQRRTLKKKQVFVKPQSPGSTDTEIDEIDIEREETLNETLDIVTQEKPKSVTNSDQDLQLIEELQVEAKDHEKDVKKNISEEMEVGKTIEKKTSVEAKTDKDNEKQEQKVKGSNGKEEGCDSNKLTEEKLFQATNSSEILLSLSEEINYEHINSENNKIIPEENKSEVVQTRGFLCCSPKSKKESKVLKHQTEIAPALVTKEHMLKENENSVDGELEKMLSEETSMHTEDNEEIEDDLHESFPAESDHQTNLQSLASGTQYNVENEKLVKLPDEEANNTRLWMKYKYYVLIPGTRAKKLLCIVKGRYNCLRNQKNIICEFMKPDEYVPQLEKKENYASYVFRLSPNEESPPMLDCEMPFIVAVPFVPTDDTKRVGMMQHSVEQNRWIECPANEIFYDDVKDSNVFLETRLPLPFGVFAVVTLAKKDMTTFTRDGLNLTCSSDRNVQIHLPEEAVRINIKAIIQTQKVDPVFWREIKSKHERSDLDHIKSASTIVEMDAKRKKLSKPATLSFYLPEDMLKVEHVLAKPKLIEKFSAEETKSIEAKKMNSFQKSLTMPKLSSATVVKDVHFMSFIQDEDKWNEVENTTVNFDGDQDHLRVNFPVIHSTKYLLMRTKRNTNEESAARASKIVCHEFEVRNCSIALFQSTKQPKIFALLVSLKKLFGVHCQELVERGFNLEPNNQVFNAELVERQTLTISFTGNVHSTKKSKNPNKKIDFSFYSMFPNIQKVTVGEFDTQGQRTQKQYRGYIDISTLSLVRRPVPGADKGKKSQLGGGQFVVQEELMNLAHLLLSIPKTTTISLPPFKEFHFRFAGYRNCLTLVKKLSTRIGLHWWQLGKSLGISESRLSSLKLNFEEAGLNVVAEQMLLFWLRGCTTYENKLDILKSALADIGRLNILDRLEKSPDSKFIFGC